MDLEIAIPHAPKKALYLTNYITYTPAFILKLVVFRRGRLPKQKPSQNSNSLLYLPENSYFIFKDLRKSSKFQRALLGYSFAFSI